MDGPHKRQVSNLIFSKLNREKEKERDELSSTDLRNTIKQSKIWIIRGERTGFKIFQECEWNVPNLENIKPLTQDAQWIPSRKIQTKPHVGISWSNFWKQTIKRKKNNKKQEGKKDITYRGTKTIIMANISLGEIEARMERPT